MACVRAAHSRRLSTASGCRGWRSSACSGLPRIRAADEYEPFADAETRPDGGAVSGAVVCLCSRYAPVRSSRSPVSDACCPCGHSAAPPLGLPRTPLARSGHRRACAAALFVPFRSCRPRLRTRCDCRARLRDIPAGPDSRGTLSSRCSALLLARTGRQDRLPDIAPWSSSRSAVPSA